MKSPKHGDQTNSDFAKNNPLFLKACELAGIPPTRRQASKFRSDRGKGKANAQRNAAKEALERP